MTVEASTSEKTSVWNPFAKGYFENPYEYLRSWRENNPVHQGINGNWVIFKYDDVKALLTNPVFKTWKTHEAVAATNQHLHRSENFDQLATVLSSVLLFQDAPEHTLLRSLISKIWNAQLAQESIHQAVEESLEALAGKAKVDLAADFARRVPTRLISKILGLPAEDYAQITNWSYQFISALEPFVSLHHLRKFNREAQAFHQYLTGVIEFKNRHPDERFISRLLTVNRALPAPLINDEIISILCMLFFAGIETSVNLLSQSILLLLKSPAQADLVREHALLSANAANELIRYVSPVNYTKRIAAEDIELRGVKIKAGESLFGAFISANFDEDVFPNSGKLDLTRAHNPHLGFGHGAHFCLGARLGREQISRSLPALFRRYPDLELDGENYRWDKLIMNRALKSLPVNLNP